MRRRGWDSNPRAAKSDNLISSQARYNHFGTSPSSSCVMLPESCVSKTLDTERLYNIGND
jgi:hypothetical protein